MPKKRKGDCGTCEECNRGTDWNCLQCRFCAHAGSWNQKCWYRTCREEKLRKRRSRAYVNPFVVSHSESILLKMKQDEKPPGWVPPEIISRKEMIEREEREKQHEIASQSPRAAPAPVKRNASNRPTKESKKNRQSDPSHAALINKSGDEREGRSGTLLVKVSSSSHQSRSETPRKDGRGSKIYEKEEARTSKRKREDDERKAKRKKKEEEEEERRRERRPEKERQREEDKGEDAAEHSDKDEDKKAALEIGGDGKNAATRVESPEAGNIDKVDVVSIESNEEEEGDEDAESNHAENKTSDGEESDESCAGTCTMHCCTSPRLFYDRRGLVTKYNGMAVYVAARFALETNYVEVVHNLKARLQEVEGLYSQEQAIPERMKKIAVLLASVNDMEFQCVGAMAEAKRIVRELHMNRLPVLAGLLAQDIRMACIYAPYQFTELPPSPP